MLVKKLNSFWAMWSADRNFRCILISFSVSTLGDQLTAMALPFLVLKLFGDPAALGMIMATMTLPRALLMLFGGALADRRAASRIVGVAQFLNMLLLLTFASLIYFDQLQRWMVYCFAFASGVSGAYIAPASSSIIAKTVRKEFIDPAIRLLMGIGQIILVLGPSLAGLVFAFFAEGRERESYSATSFTVAFLLDAVTFGVSALAMKCMMEKKREVVAENTDSSIKVIVAGLRYVWRDARLRVNILYGTSIAFFVSAPLSIGLPVLAGHFGQGTSVYGMLMSATGAGVIAGSIVTGLKPDIRFKNVGKTILLVDAIIAILIILLGQSTNTWIMAVLMFTYGALFNYLSIMVYTWTQRRVSPAMLGRTMSVFMCFSTLSFPISTALSGWILAKAGFKLFFSGFGFFYIALILFAAFFTLMPTLSDRIRRSRFSPEGSST